MRNRYVGTCNGCGASVGVEQGFVSGPPWVTKCALCSGKLDSVKVEVARDGANVMFRLHGYLGGRFGEYREATANARYDGQRKVNVAALDKAVVIVDKLRQAGFVVEMLPELSAALQAKTADLKSNLGEAEGRLSEADALLRERGLSLFPFQRIGVRWLTNRWGALLADQMGLGKTIQALLAIPKDAPVLIVAPAVAKGVWKREAAKWRPDLKITLLSGHGSFRWPEPGEIVIINYDVLPPVESDEAKLLVQPLPVDWRDKTCERTENFKLGTETSFTFQHEGTDKVAAFIWVSEDGSLAKGAEWWSAHQFDENTPESNRTYTLGEELVIPPNRLVLPNVPSRVVRPKFAHIIWSTVQNSRFGVHVERKMAPPPPSPKARPGTVLIADEAHAVKNSKAQRTVRFRTLADAVRSAQGKVWLLTATPLLNRPAELWSILQAGDVGREAFGNWDGFCAAFNGYRGRYGYEWGTPNEAKITECLRKVSLRRMRTDVLPELPTKTYRQIAVPLDARSTKACDKAMEILRATIPSLWDRVMSEDPLSSPDHEPLTPDHVEEARTKIVHMNGSAFTEFSKARELLARAKIPSLLELVVDFEEQEEPVIVFSAHRHAIDLLGARDGWAAITGDTPAEERTRIEDAFQSGKLKGVAATIKAGGVAITLTRACHAVFLDEELTPALNEQAEDRVCRIGQDRGVVITQLVAEHPLDSRIFTLLTAKATLINASVDAARIRSDETVEPLLLPDVDFARLAEQAADESRKADEAKKAADERTARFAAERTQAIAEGRQVSPDFRPATAVGEPERRGPSTPREKWAMTAVTTLAGLDPDRAVVRNDVGFSASDGGIGHQIAREVVFGLTDKQWELSVALCTKYWRQVGRPPASA